MCVCFVCEGRIRGLHSTLPKLKKIDRKYCIDIYHLFFQLDIEEGTVLDIEHSQSWIILQNSELSGKTRQLQLNSV